MGGLSKASLWKSFVPGRELLELLWVLFGVAIEEH